MKKIFTLSAFIGLAFGANAQRMLDISATITRPPTSVHIDSSSNFVIGFYLKNEGTAVTLITDTLVYKMTVAGQAVRLNGDSLFYAYPVKALNPGDTQQVASPSLHFTHYPFTSTGTADICVVFLGIENPSNPATDNNSANNQSCNTITFWGLNVPNVTSVGMLSVYPNPAQSNLNMDLNLNEGGNVVVKVVDVTGRTVLTENKGTLNAGEHRLDINTSSLGNGVYVYQLMVNDVSATGRFSIAK